MATISTDLNILITPGEWQKIASRIPELAAARGYQIDTIHAQPVDLTCEPDNMLVNQYELQEGHVPFAEQLHRIVISGESELSLVDATKAIVAALPENTYWYGTSLEGVLNPGVTAACAWQSN